MLTIKTNIKRPTDCVKAPYLAKESDGRNKATKLIGTGKQRDFVAYDLQGKGTFTSLVNQLDVTTFRHMQSTQTEAQQIRIVSHMRRIARELAYISKTNRDKPERVKKLNDLLDTYHARLQKLQAIVAKRHNVAIK